MPAIDRYLSVRMRALLLIAGQVVARIGPDLIHLANILILSSVMYPMRYICYISVCCISHLEYNTRRL